MRTRESCGETSAPETVAQTELLAASRKLARSLEVFADATLELIDSVDEFVGVIGAESRDVLPLPTARRVIAEHLERLRR